MLIILFVAVMPAIREEHIAYVTELARVGNEITTTARDTPASDKENRLLRDLAIRGLKHISSWNSTVTELVRPLFKI